MALDGWGPLLWINLWLAWEEEEEGNAKEEETKALRSLFFFSYAGPKEEEEEGHPTLSLSPFSLAAGRRNEGRRVAAVNSQKIMRGGAKKHLLLLISHEIRMSSYFLGAPPYLFYSVARRGLRPSFSFHAFPKGRGVGPSLITPLINHLIKLNGKMVWV